MINVQVKYSSPTKTPDAEATIKVNSHAAGNDTIYCVYSDGGGLIGACEEMGINRDPYQPKIHENNALIERVNQEYIDGTRTHLVNAGFPPYFWSLAGIYYTMATNITEACPNEEHF